MRRKLEKQTERHSANLAAEYFVASQLFRLGYIVLVTFGNTKQIDLVVVHPDHKRKVTIDVKGLKNTTNWPIPKNPLRHRDHFFILVTFKNKIKQLSAMPTTYVVPSGHVNRIAGQWSTGQRAIGYDVMRNNKKYENRWDLLFDENVGDQ